MLHWLGARCPGPPGKMVAVTRVLHILPHRGGGETYVDRPMGLDGCECLAPTARERARGAFGIERMLGALAAAHADALR
ncbi:MAG: hypothetical protein QOG56_2974 [Solirubrobacteraceae bacterium]|nr:hypothetical protein [Solirubrobacteraceae bacterium]